MSVVAGVRNDHRQVGESSSVEARTSLGFLDESSRIPGHLASTPNGLREQAVDSNEFSDRFTGDFFPEMMEMAVRKPMFCSLTNMTGIASPLEPTVAVSNGVRRSSRLSRKPGKAL